VAKIIKKHPAWVLRFPAAQALKEPSRGGAKLRYLPNLDVHHTRTDLDTVAHAIEGEPVVLVKRRRAQLAAGCLASADCAERNIKAPTIKIGNLEVARCRRAGVVRNCEVDDGLLARGDELGLRNNRHVPRPVAGDCGCDVNEAHRDKREQTDDAELLERGHASPFSPEGIVGTNFQLLRLKFIPSERT
jgi:hypothetical protein